MSHFMDKQMLITSNSLASCKDPPGLKLYCSLMISFSSCKRLK